MRNRATYFILFAFVLSVLMPAAPSLVGGKSFIEICTAQGIERIAIDNSDEDTPHPSFHEKCPLCLKVSDDQAILVVHQVNHDLVDVIAVLGEPFHQPPLPYSILSSAPRAPPLS
ncbi:MAG: DUF2946 family protein [Pseudomonadota bacterium]